MRQRRHDTRAREARVLRLRAEGHGFQAIAELVGVSTASAAHRIYRRAADATVREAAHDLRELEGARLDALQATWWPRATNGDHKAAQVVLRIMERRAKLHRLDVAADLPAAGNPAEDEELDRAVSELLTLWQTSSS